MYYLFFYDGRICEKTAKTIYNKPPCKLLFWKFLKIIQHVYSTERVSTVNYI